MNILDKHSPNTGNGSSSVCAVSGPPSSGSMTPSSTDCIIPNSQLIPSLAVPPSSTAPSSVSSSSAPHTPIDSLNVVNCQSDLTSSNLPNRPNVSTPSSVFNNSAPNTPRPCPSVGSDANITSPALNHQLDYGDPKMFSSGPVPTPQALANNNINNPVLSPSLNVPPSMCNDNKKPTMSNGGGNGSNKKHCNRNQQQNSFANVNVKCENANGPPMTKNQMNFAAPNNMPCNGSHLNGNASPFDVESKMGGQYIKSEYPVNEFAQPVPNEMIPSMGNMQRLPNCSVGPMNAAGPMQPNMIANAQGKMCGGNIAPHGMAKPPPMDSQYMQHQSQIFVFNTALANQAADSVDNGQFESIIDFHLANPLTKNFLEKHSLKFPNLVQRPTHWAGNMRQPRMRGPNPNGMSARGNFNNSCFPFNQNPPGPGPGGGPQWNGPNPNGNWPNQSFGPNEMNMKMQNFPPRPYDQQFNNNYNNAHYSQGDMHDLTPQQKQHREKQLAILANLQERFCPEMMEPNNRPLSQPSQPNEFSIIDPLIPNNPNQGLPLMAGNDKLNPMIPSDNFNSAFPPNMMNNQPGNDQWAKSNPFPDEKPTFNGRRKGSQSGNQSNMAPHQSPLSQQSINSPNSCITSSPGNRVPPPPYNSGMRPISSPHPASPAGTSLSLPSPRIHTNDARQAPYPSGGVRSGPTTPSADNANCTLINSPKSSHCNNTSSRSSNANTSPGNKKAKPSLDNDLNMLNSFPAKTELLPVPSPKQIDYISTLEGHELTIHKQPNAHFQENDLLSGNDLSNDLFPNDFANICSSVNNPQNLSDVNPNHRFPPNSACNFDSNSKFPGSEVHGRYNGFPMEGFRQSNVCPPQFNQNEGMRFMNCDSSKNRLNPSADIAFSAPNSMGDINYNNSIPPMNHEGPPFPNGPNHNFNGHPDSMGSTHLQNLQKMTPPFDISNKDGMMPNSKSLPPNMVNSGNNHNMVPNSMHPNIPQNPNHRMPNFDMPCNDMNEPNSFPPPNMHQPNMQMGYPPNFGPGSSPRMPSNLPNDPHFGVHPNNTFNMPMNASMDQNNPNAPNSMPMMMQGPQSNLRFPGNVNRPVNPSNTHGTRYNSPNIQVKPDAPNTIQYLPSRPQGHTNTPPNRPPNLDFLQQSLSMSNKPPNNNVPYFPNNAGPMSMPPRPMQSHMNFNRAPLMRPQNGPMPSNQPPPNNDMFCRMPGPPNLMNGPNNMPMNVGPPNNFGPPGQVASKPNSVPVMHDNNQAFNYNKPPFSNPTDPNYADSFHNFQQQLYATNTRNSNNPRMTSNF